MGAWENSQQLTMHFQLGLGGWLGQEHVPLAGQPGSHVHARYQRFAQVRQLESGGSGECQEEGGKRVAGGVTSECVGSWPALNQREH